MQLTPEEIAEQQKNEEKGRRDFSIECRKKEEDLESVISQSPRFG